MGCDAKHDQQLAPGPYHGADVDAQYLRPKPEHTGMGFPDEGVWEPDAASAGDRLLHPQFSGFRFHRAVAMPGCWSGGDDERCPFGGGAFRRTLSQDAGSRVYRVRKLSAAGEFATITQALAQWETDKRTAAGSRAAVIEIADSATYHEAPAFMLGAGEYLQLRAASQARPVLRMFDYHTGAPEQVRIGGAAGSRFTMDGLMVAGGSIDIVDAAPAGQGGAHESVFQVALRHCTLVPGWDPDFGGQAQWRLPSSVNVHAARLALRIDCCITGPLRIAGEGAGAQPVALQVRDSVIDSGHAAGLAIADHAHGAALVHAAFTRATVIGVAQLLRLDLAENCLFMGALLAGRRTEGLMRFCYVSPGSRTPRRLHCQPELAQYAPGMNAEREAARVRPRFVSLRFGTPGYARLAPDCAEEIMSGAEDDNAMGAFYDGQFGLPPPVGADARAARHPLPS